MLAWAAEFGLETSGAYLAYRRKLTILFALLFTEALSDVETFVVLWLFGGNAYGYAAWTAEAVQYLILCILAFHLAGRMARDYRRIAPFACMLAVMLGAIVGFFFQRGEAWRDKFLDAEISASCW